MSVRITGDVCAYLVSFVRGKGTKTEGNLAGVVRPASCIDNGGLVPC